MEYPETLFSSLNLAQCGVCMLVAEILNDYFLSQGKEDYSIIEGYVTFKNCADEFTHTWIENFDGTIIDPSLIQFGGYKWDKNPNREITSNFNPLEYKKLSEEYPVNALGNIS